MLQHSDPRGGGRLLPAHLHAINKVPTLPARGAPIASMELSEAFTPPLSAPLLVKHWEELQDGLCYTDTKVSSKASSTV